MGNKCGVGHCPVTVDRSVFMHTRFGISALLVHANRLTLTTARNILIPVHKALIGLGPGNSQLKF
jgi:hypothetical protein